jgi:hypothetical protein
MNEPVAWMDEKGILWNSVTHPDNYTALYTAPPKKEWVGLTDADLVDCETEFDVAFAQAIEAKLKEKNT